MISIRPLCRTGKKKFKEDDSQALGGVDEMRQRKGRIAKQGRVVDQKEAETALLKNFFARADHD